ncbi:MAG: ribosome assembly factor SBDS [Candidatus Thermoplasmatota archaeon]|nr:ribosome assembly factor SBDS [Candidatus Thermoplasmatota archaeon]
MVRVEDAIVARLESHGHKFEIFVDPDAADRIKEGNIDLANDLALDEIYKDARKGEKAGDESLKEVFKTTDTAQIAIEIIKKGQIQLTTEQRHEMLEKRRKQIIETISRESINPQTNAPNPPQRISQAMDEAKVHIDPFKSVGEQMQTVLKAIKPLLPIRMEKTKLAVKLTGDAYGKIYGDIIRGGYLVKEEWGKDGAWIGLLEVPSGMTGDIMSSLGRKAKDNVEIKIIKNR